MNAFCSFRRTGRIFYVKMKGYDVMKKIFISQPMRDKTKDEILREREKVAKAFSKYYGEDVEILESYFKDYAPRTAVFL